MAYQIRISPNALRAAAERHLTVTAAVDEATARLSNLVTALNAAWDGGASNEALSTMREIREAIANISEGTAGHADKLKRIAEAFEALDESGTPSGIAIMTDFTLPPLVGPGGMLRKFNWFLQNTLRIVPDEVRQVADQCRHISNELQETAHKLKADVDGLAADWEGRSYDRFAAQSHEMIAAFRHGAERLDQFADTIARAADRYEALDNSLA